MLAQHKDAEVGFNERISKMQDEKKVFQERITGLQRAIAQLDAEKRETERSAVRLEKDRSALKKTLDKVWSFVYFMRFVSYIIAKLLIYHIQVERDRLKTEEEAMRLSENRGQLDRSIRDLESEIDEAHKTIQVCDMFP